MAIITLKSIQGRASVRMVAAARQLLSELARGLTTALSIRAARTECPTCPTATLQCAPSLVCSEAPRCPDCVCEQGRRVCPEAASGFELALVCLCLGIVIGFTVSEGRRRFYHWWIVKSDGRAPSKLSAAAVALQNRK